MPTLTTKQGSRFNYGEGKPIIHFHVDVINIEENILKKYLSTEAYYIVDKRVDFTVVEHKSYNKEKNKLQLSANLVGFMGVKITEEPTEQHIEKFCNFINERVNSHDFFLGCLCKPCKFQYEGFWYLIFQPVFRNNIVELYDKYPYFHWENNLPHFILD